MKRVLRVLLPLLILAAGAALVAVMVTLRKPVKPAPKEPNVPLVQARTLHPQSHRFVVHAQGTVSPRVEINLAAEVPGRVAEVSANFAPGGFFEAGEVLVKLDTRDFDLALTRANAQLAAAEVRFAREQAEAEVALEEWKSLGLGEASPLARREPQLAEAKAGVDSARAAVQQAQLDLERCAIKAPFAGRVWSKRADIGQFLARGEAVARIYSADAAEVRLPLSMEELGYLDLPVAFDGTAAEKAPEVILSAAVGGAKGHWKGRIVRTEAEVDSRTRMIHAIARVERPFAAKPGKPPLAIGLFVQAEIRGREVQNALVAPRASMLGSDRLIVVDTENRLRFRPVKVLRLEMTRAVLAADLTEGDRICVSILDAPVDGMAVRPVEEKL